MVDDYLNLYLKLAGSHASGMSGAFQFRIFAHSWVSDWNHGNAHFLRGLARELQASWAMKCVATRNSVRGRSSNLVSQEGERAHRRHRPVSQ